MGTAGAGKESIIGVTSGHSLDWFGRSGIAMLSSKGLAKGGGKDFHKAGSAWRAGDVVEMTVHKNGNMIFSVSATPVSTMALQKKGSYMRAGVSMWSAGSTLEIIS